MCSESNITCHQMTSFRCWHTEFYKDLEDLYSILSNESPSTHAECFKSIPPKEVVYKYNKDEMLLYSVYTGQTMGSTLLKHQRRGSPKEICNSLNACNGIPCPKHYTPIRKFETVFMSRLECTVLLS